VFTARYALSPYIKQICFVFKWLIDFTHEMVKLIRPSEQSCIEIKSKKRKITRKFIIQQEHRFSNGDDDDDDDDDNSGVLWFAKIRHPNKGVAINVQKSH
jgi:hypothetical protein